MPVPNHRQLALATGQGGGRSETTLFQQMLDYSPDIVVQPLAGTKYCTGNCVGKYMFTAKGADYSGASPSKPLDMDALAKKYIQALHGKPPDADAPSARKVNTKLADRQSDDTSEEDATEMHPKVGIFDTPRRFREGLSKHWTAIDTNDASAAPATPSAQEPKLERVSKASAPAAVAAGDTGEPDCDSLEDFDAWLECSEKVRLHVEHGWGV